MSTCQVYQEGADPPRGPRREVCPGARFLLSANISVLGPPPALRNRNLLASKLHAIRR
ncbi:hypothetical protein BGW80DRAFT_1322575 [Lactifluus volemus]|nr:hypothetical protein BGW80DRAFT_1322575 [Lactifluus volemus]